MILNHWGPDLNLHPPPTNFKSFCICFFVAVSLKAAILHDSSLFTRLLQNFKMKVFQQGPSDGKVCLLTVIRDHIIHNNFLSIHLIHKRGFCSNVRVQVVLSGLMVHWFIAGGLYCRHTASTSFSSQEQSNSTSL